MNLLTLQTNPLVPSSSIFNILIAKFKQGGIIKSRIMNLKDEKRRERVVFSLGGSLVVPNEVNVSYLRQFRDFIFDFVNNGWSFVLVVGGGAPARNYIQAAKEIIGDSITHDDMDWLGIHATRFNAHLIRTIFRPIAQPVIITNPEEDYLDTTKPVIVSGGWKPGWSTDYVAVKIANRLKAKTMINLSNIKYVYSADPKKDPHAKPLKDMLWKDFIKLVGDKWIPGMSAPFDPVASKQAMKTNLNVYVTEGSDLENVKRILQGENYTGTLLHN